MTKYGLIRLVHFHRSIILTAYHQQTFFIGAILSRDEKKTFWCIAWRQQFDKSWIIWIRDIIQSYRIRSFHSHKSDHFFTNIT